MGNIVPNRWLGIFALLAAAGGCAEAVVSPSATCDVRVERHEVLPTDYERVDLLFVLDHAPSMAQERRHFLEVQLPRATHFLLGGETEGSSRLSNLHVGVISSDMGVGVDGLVDGCSASGDDGKLLNAAACQASEPAFAWYYQGKHDRRATESAVACMADVGDDGCQVSQPLEAALKALWPAASADSGGGPPLLSENFRFRGDSVGHGLDANANFLRSAGQLSMIIVIIITDQDDCSTIDPTTFAGPGALGCIRDPDKLRVLQTYVSGLRALRPDIDELLNVGIIAGVPPEWVSSVLAPAREAPFDASLLRGAYDGLLTDPRMQQDPNEVVSSCSSAIATATAPRRLMQFARNLGRAAFVQSICDYDLTDMLQQMLEFIPPSFGEDDGLCVHMPLVPDGSGSVPCRMTWELPEHADPEEPLSPASCAERADILAEPEPGLARRSERGRVLCELRQAPVLSGLPQGEGFYHLPGERCFSGLRPTRIGFTEGARIPPGVTARIECVDATQRLRAPPEGGPAIGHSCLQPDGLQSSDQRCGNAVGDHGPGKLFCDTQTNRCVQGCDDDAHCPPDWVCDQASRICVRSGCE